VSKCALCGLIAVLFNIGTVSAESCLEWSSYTYDNASKKMIYTSSSYISVKSPKVVVSKFDKDSFVVVKHPVHSKYACGPRFNDYAKDKSRVFYKGEIIRGADPKSFELLEFAYSRDKSFIFARNKKITNRTSHFSYLNGAGYATDGIISFYYDIVIRDKSFEVLSTTSEYARSEARVFYKGVVLDGVDPSSFEVVGFGDEYTKDKSHVFYKNNIINNADTETFRWSVHYLYVDSKSVYLEGKEIEGANPVTLSVLPNSDYILDDKSVFLKHNKLDRDVDTFKSLQAPFSIDKNGAYCNNIPMKNVDLATFKSTFLSEAEDKNYRYRCQCFSVDVSKNLDDCLTVTRK
jgi:DKNYY family